LGGGGIQERDIVFRYDYNFGALKNKNKKKEKRKKKNLRELRTNEF